MSFEQILLGFVLFILVIAVSIKEWVRYERRKAAEAGAIGNRKLFRKNRN